MTTRLPFLDTPSAVLKLAHQRGWPVTENKDHYRVGLPGGDYLTIPRSTSKGMRIWTSTNQKLRRAINDRPVDHDSVR